MSDSTKRRRLLEELNEIEDINNVSYVCTQKLHDPLERNINIDDPPIAGQYNSSYVDPKNTVFDEMTSDQVDEKCSNNSNCKYIYRYL